MCLGAFMAARLSHQLRREQLATRSLLWRSLPDKCSPTTIPMDPVHVV